MAVGSWEVPFVLRSERYSSTPLQINSPVTFGSAGVGRILLVPDKCKLRTDVRATVRNMPQQDGSIFGRFRYVTGCQMDLVFQLWEADDNIACDELLQAMVDTLNGYLYGLLNATDNQGRISWLPAGFSSPVSNYRMLEDIRLFKYPDQTQQPSSAMEVAVTVDSQYPYAADETQDNPSIPGVVTVEGNRFTFPVWKLYGPFTTVTVTDSATGASWTYDGSLNGAVAVGGGDYLEVDTFRDTVYLNGSGANRKPGIVMTTSDFFTLGPGSHTIGVTYGGGAGGASLMLVNGAWA